jgi:hypothetical protein
MQILRGLTLVGVLVSTFIVGELSVRSTEGRKGGSVVVGPTVGLTGVVDNRYCRYRSVELVYPCVGARSWSCWPTGRNRIQGCPVAERRTCDRRPTVISRRRRRRFTKARRYLSETFAGDRNPPEGITATCRS